ncbi:hypothetical protein EV361DRAFT_943507 [Lentinula raphanica]|nr:hypothetical protein EV361DRAFT_943507 [Lentinula raphanica]
MKIIMYSVMFPLILVIPANGLRIPDGVPTTVRPNELRQNACCKFLCQVQTLCRHIHRQVYLESCCNGWICTTSFNFIRNRSVILENPRQCNNRIVGIKYVLHCLNSNCSSPDQYALCYC